MRFRLVPKSSTSDDLEQPKRTLLQKRGVFWSPLLVYICTQPHRAPNLRMNINQVYDINRTEAIAATRVRFTAYELCGDRPYPGYQPASRALDPRDNAPAVSAVNTMSCRKIMIALR